MPEVNFFVPKGPFTINELLDHKSKLIIPDLKILEEASKNHITFFNSLNYKALAQKTKAGACITSENLSKYLPKNCEKI